MNKQILITALAIVTFCIPSSLWAQTSKSTLREKITITADEISDDHFSSYLDVIIVEPTEHSESLATFLKNKKGISVRQTGGTGTSATASIRGVGIGKAEQVLVLLDGVRLNKAQGTGVDLSRIPLSIVEKIEIIRGGCEAFL